MNILDFIFIPLVVWAGHVITGAILRKKNLGQFSTIVLRLYYFHLLLAIAFGLYVTNFGGDAVSYWEPPSRFLRIGTSPLALLKPGTPFIFFVTYPFSQILGISFWAGCFLFGVIGFGGFLCLFLIWIEQIKFNPTLFGYKLFPWLLFLPNLHFWSGGIGKDSLIFLALTLFIYGLTKPSKYLLAIGVGVVLAYYVRPHIALLMIVSLGGSLVVSSGAIPAFWRVTLILASIALFLVVAPTVFEFIGLEEETLTTLDEVAGIRSKNLSRARVGSAIDINSYPVPLKMATFLFRPLFVDAGNIFGLFVSFENLLYVLLFFAVLRWRNVKRALSMPVYLKAAFLILISGTFFLSSSMGNLGIIVRQKNMVMFMLLLLCLYFVSLDQNVKRVTRRSTDHPARHRSTDNHEA